MKKGYTYVVLLAAAGLFVLGCQRGYGGYGVKGERETAATASEQTAAALWDEMQSADYRAKWRYWPGKGAMYKGTKPHGAFLTTYVNDVAYDAIVHKRGSLPYGSIVVKENYMPDKRLGAITVMKKVRGFNPGAGDWYWVKFAPDGQPMVMEKGGMKMTLAGKVPGCIACHGARSANDYIYTSPLR